MNYRGSISTVSPTKSISFGFYDSVKPVVRVSAFHGSLSHISIRHAEMF